jgi:acyl-coenzyme A synthetase/AMP-(fatty) acid ligase
MRIDRHLRLAFDPRLTVGSLLERAAEMHGDKPLLWTERPLGYPGFASPAVSALSAWKFACQVTEALWEVGMRQGDRVAIFKRNEADYPLLSLGVISAGGVAVPINPGMDRNVLAQHLRQTKARFLCCDHATFTGVIGDRLRLPMVEGWIFTDEAPTSFKPRMVLSEAVAALPGDAPPVSVDPSAPVLLAHTSGTTGRPKVVTCTAGSFLAGVRTHFRTEPPLPWRRVGIAGSFSHLVYQIGLTTLLLSGMRAWPLDGSSAVAALQLIEREQVNVFVAFPHLYQRMYARGLSPYDLRSMRLWVSVADTSREAHMAAFCREGSRYLGSVFVEPLGSSEIGAPALRRVWTVASRPRCRRHIGRRMLGGPQVKVVDSAGRRAKAGEPGRLMVKGRTVFAGYWPNTRRSQGDVEEWWATGDIAYRDRWNRYFHLDREANVVHTDCGPFYTLPAEDVLHLYPGVYEAVVFGVTTDEGRERPIAYVWADPGGGVNPERLLAWANRRVSGPVPLSRLYLIPPDEISRGLTGKVLKRELRTRHGHPTDGNREAA